jgi:hypothetical protein
LLSHNMQLRVKMKRMSVKKSRDSRQQILIKFKFSSLFMRTLSESDITTSVSLKKVLNLSKVAPFL